MACWLQPVPEDPVNTNACPTAPLRPGAPMSAVLPSVERATLCPKSEVEPTVSLLALWLQLVPERVNSHTAPARLLSAGAPIRAVEPSPESATLVPNCPATADSPLPTGPEQLLVHVPSPTSSC
jgi:hypothetical protein